MLSSALWRLVLAQDQVLRRQDLEHSLHETMME